VPEVTHPAPPEHPLGHISDVQVDPAVQLAVHAHASPQSTALQPLLPVHVTEHEAAAPHWTSPQALVPVHETVHAAWSVASWQSMFLQAFVLVQLILHVAACEQSRSRHALLVVQLNVQSQPVGQSIVWLQLLLDVQFAVQVFARTSQPPLQNEGQFAGMQNPEATSQSRTSENPAQSASFVHV
jgi:hypothetical protein